MKKDNFVLQLILHIFILLCCIVLSVMCYIKINVCSGIIWTITSTIWSYNIGYHICKRKNQDYIDFLEFMAYNYLSIIKQGELNAKSKQDNKGTEHKGE